MHRWWFADWAFTLWQIDWGHVRPRLVGRSVWVKSWLGDPQNFRAIIHGNESHLTYKHQSTSTVLGLFVSVFSPGLTSLGLDLCLLGTLGVCSQVSYSFILIIHMTSGDLGAHCPMKTHSPGFSVYHRPGLIVWLWTCLLNIYQALLILVSGNYK